MKLNEALANSPSETRSPQKQTNLFLSGSLEPDGDEKLLRIYQYPENKSWYFLIAKEAIESDVYQWTEAEAAAAGHVGFTLHRLEIPRGTPVLVVSVSAERIGETISVSAGEEVASKSTAGSVCKRVTDCGEKPCCIQAGPTTKCYCSNCCVA